MLAVRLLERLGYRRLGHFAGGIQAWRKAGLPFESTEETEGPSAGAPA